MFYLLYLYDVYHGHLISVVTYIYIHLRSYKETMVHHVLICHAMLRRMRVQYVVFEYIISYCILTHYAAYINIGVRVCTDICIYMYVYYICVCTYIYTYVCMYYAVAVHIRSDSNSSSSSRSSSSSSSGSSSGSSSRRDSGSSSSSSGPL